MISSDDTKLSRDLAFDGTRSWFWLDSDTIDRCEDINRWCLKFAPLEDQPYRIVIFHILYLIYRETMLSKNLHNRSCKQPSSLYTEPR